MKNSCAQWVSNPGTSVYEAKSLSVALLDQISMEHFNIDCVLPEWAIKFITFSTGRCSEVFVVYFCQILFVSFCCLTNKTFLYCKELTKCKTRRTFYNIYHLVHSTG